MFEVKIFFGQALDNSQLSVEWPLEYKINFWSEYKW